MTADRYGEEPEYNRFRNMEAHRGQAAEACARQVIATTRPFRSKAEGDLDVLDVGSGYGDTALALAPHVRSVVGVEPSRPLVASAEEKRSAAGVANVTFVEGVVEDLDDEARFDVVVLDNVYEHLPDQERALRAMVRALRPGGVLYLLTPNKWWPLEVHYRLPFLAWLPLPLANLYLRLSGRGSDYTDASYAPSYRQLKRTLGRIDGIDFAFTLPGDPGATVAGTPLHYRVGMALIRRLPFLWGASKALLVVVTRRG